MAVSAWKTKVEAMMAVCLIRFEYDRTENGGGCSCDLRTKAVGDGCEVCNPELAADLAKEEVEEC